MVTFKNAISVLTLWSLCHIYICMNSYIYVYEFFLKIHPTKSGGAKYQSYIGATVMHKNIYIYVGILPQKIYSQNIQ